MQIPFPSQLGAIKVGLVFAKLNFWSRLTLCGKEGALEILLLGYFLFLFAALFFSLQQQGESSSSALRAGIQSSHRTGARAQTLFFDKNGRELGSVLLKSCERDLFYFSPSFLSFCPAKKADRSNNLALKQRRLNRVMLNLAQTFGGASFPLPKMYKASSVQLTELELNQTWIPIR